jgi:hypothetical protein
MAIPAASVTVNLGRLTADCATLPLTAGGYSYAHIAPVAQLDRAPDYESGGQEFESLRARHP